MVVAVVILEPELIATHPARSTLASSCALSVAVSSGLFRSGTASAHHRLVVVVAVVATVVLIAVGVAVALPGTEYGGGAVVAQPATETTAAMIRPFMIAALLMTRRLHLLLLEVE